MLLSGDWKDYELLDCSRGERLERWGPHILVRPDPQVIWDTPRRRAEWSRPAARYVRSASGGGQWEKRDLPDSWNIRYGALTFLVRPTNFKHTGLFPEQAVNWDYMARRVRAASDAGRRLSVLNLFAYTGAATLALAAAGADVCHVDASRGMVAWARENAAASGLSDKPVRWIIDDCAKFLEREIRRGRRYDAIVMDPPSYGRGPSGETWKLEDDLFNFVQIAVRALSDDPSFVIINSYTTGLSPASLAYIASSLISKRFGGRVDSQELGLPVTESGLVLPCGAATRWEQTA
ncbi:MAG: class I SAM-dependent methyltransferase [Oscillospiraceae bacterium]|jgi:23S rRNA (cytosine1962-C5)-methyltransferase|nr:class I SAM-dependent methyltransferase [Oscillospiraceae bacterium]